MAKNLANCTPREFLVQTNKIRKTAAKWLELTDILNIRKNTPELKQAPSDASEDEKKQVHEANKKLIEAQAKENLSLILDKILDENVDATLELLALCCFVDPKDVDNHPISFYLTNLTELLGNEEVIGFFTALLPLVQKAG